MWGQASPNPLQVSEVHALLELMEIKDPDEKTKYLNFAQELDRIELNHLYLKSKQGK